MITATFSLEARSLWYCYKDAVWNRQTEQANTVHNIMRVLRAAHNMGEFAYVSTPITSGRHLYELEGAEPFLSAAGRLQEAIWHNHREGLAFVEVLKGRLGCPILFPSDLIPIHQWWEQAHYQALWLSIIAEKCTQLHMNRGWEYSSGCCEEFTHVMQLRLGLPQDPDGQLIFFNTKEDEAAERERMRSIKVFDYHGRELTLDAGLEQIEVALEWIRSNGFEAPKLERCPELLKDTSTLIAEGYYQ